jgi:hypothetical protein
MRTIATIALTLAAVAALPSPSTAAPLDGSVPIVCAATEIRECDHTGACTRRTAEEVNLPVLLRVDVRQKVLSSLEADRTAPIHAVERQDGRLVLHGGQGGRGWTAVIAEASGRLSASVVDEQAGFMVFGACAVPGP